MLRYHYPRMRPALQIHSQSPCNSTHRGWITLSLGTYRILPSVPEKDEGWYIRCFFAVLLDIKAGQLASSPFPYDVTDMIRCAFIHIKEKTWEKSGVRILSWTPNPSRVIFRNWRAKEDVCGHLSPSHCVLGSTEILNARASGWQFTEFALLYRTTTTSS